MKTKLLHFCLMLIFSSFFIGCGNDDDDVELIDHGTGYYWLSDYSDSWSDILLGLDGSSILYRKANATRNPAVVASIKVGQQLVKYTIISNNLGLPQSISVDDHDLIFRYTSDNKVSLAIIGSTGLTSSIRNVRSNMDFSDLGNENIEDLGIWDNLSSIKSVSKLFKSELADKIPEVEEKLNAMLQVLEKVKYLEETESYSFKEMDEYLKEVDIESSINIAENLLHAESNSENKDKALKILSINFEIANSLEVTNQSVLWNVESVLVDIVGELASPFSYTLGIRYCHDSGDPTKTGTEASEVLNYNPVDVGETNSLSFNLIGLQSPKKYKYCVFVKIDDFIEYGEIRTFETVYVNIESWQQTGSAQGSFLHDGKTYNYEFSMAQPVLLSGDIGFIEEWGVWSQMLGHYGAFNGIITGNWTMNWMYWSTASSVSDVHTPYVKFKDGKYYMGTPVTINLSHTITTRSQYVADQANQGASFVICSPSEY
ncbi:MAG: hypothetical protein AB2L20_08265 [Mangrovibacterium sp.]